jgi:hypothetical protein
LTICMALRCRRKHEGRTVPAILFAADTQGTTGTGQKRPVNKISRVTPKGLPPIFLAGAGDGYSIDEFAADFTDEMENLANEVKNSKNKAERKLPQATSVILWTFRKEIGNLAYNVFEKYSRRTGKKSDHYFATLIGTSDEITGSTELLFVDGLGRFERIGQFEALGTGADSGGRLLLQQLYSPEMNTLQAARLAAFVIEQVGSVDAYVSGLQKMKLTYLGKADDFDEKHEEIVAQARNRFELFNHSWRLTEQELQSRL